MKLHWGQTWAFAQVLNLFNSLGKDQKTLVEEIGGGVLNADLSRAKAGYVPPKKWAHIVERCYEIAEKEMLQSASTATSKRAVEQIRTLIDTRLRSPLSNVTMDKASLAEFPELEIASLARYFNQLLNPDIWNVTSATSIFTAHLTYPRVPDEPIDGMNRKLLPSLIGENWQEQYQETKRLAKGMKSFQDDMERVIFKENTAADKCQILPAASEIRGLLSPARIKTTALIYLVPFFYTADRRADYGVIRYGKHRSLGMLASRATLNRILGSQPEVIKREQFIRFINPTVKIHHVAPYSAEHIICQMLLEFHDEELLAKFNEANIPPESDFSQAAKSLAEKPDTRIFLFDLPEKFELARELSNYASAFADHAIVRLDHGVDLDVGVGYSLRAFDWIVKDGRFKNLHRQAFDLVRKIGGDLKLGGIEIDETTGKKHQK